MAVGLVVGACGGGDPTATPRPTATAPPQATATTAMTAATATPAPTPVPSTPTPDPNEPKLGGVLNVGHWSRSHGGGSVPNVLGPPSASGRSLNYAGYRIYNRVLQRDPWDRDVVKGDLAESWSFDDSGTTLTFKFRQDVTWQDGQPFTARDVADGLNTHLDPPEGRTRASFAGLMATAIDTVTATDDSTVQIRLNEVDASLLIIFTDAAALILPSHIPLDVLDTAPVGTGPWKLTRIQRDSFTEVERYDNYFERDAAGRARPYMDGIKTFGFADGALLVSAFRTGAVDLAQDQNSPVIFPQLDEIKKDIPNVQLRDRASGNFTVAVRNVPPFDDFRVRKAMFLWLDRKEMTDLGLAGGGSPWHTGVGAPPYVGGPWGLPMSELMAVPGFRYLDASGKLVTSWEEAGFGTSKWDELRKDPADRERAREILANVGIDPGDVSVGVTLAPYELNRQGPILITQLQELFGSGVKLVTVSDSATMNADFRAGNFTLLFLSAGSFALDDPVTSFGRGGWISTDPTFQGTGFDPDPQLEALFEQQRRTLDFAQRQAIVKDMTRRMFEVLFSIGTGTQLQSQVHREYVKNVPFYTSSGGNYWKLQRTWLERPA